MTFGRNQSSRQKDFLLRVHILTNGAMNYKIIGSHQKNPQESMANQKYFTHTPHGYFSERKSLGI